MFRRYSNCFIFAAALALRRWHTRGYLALRKSDWGRFPHVLWIERNHIVSYKPVDPTKRRCPPLLFKGHVVWGDKPPAQNPELKT